jgi:hypothetical protein
MKYRIKAIHYKSHSRYFPQWKFFWFWVNFKRSTCLGNYAEFFSKKDAQKFIDDDIDKTHPRIEYIPYE